MPLIGFDAQAMQGRRSGLGVYASNLLDALKAEIPRTLQLQVYREEMSPEQNVNTFRRLRWENWTLPNLIRRDKADVLHVPGFAPGVVRSCRLVVTVHDIAGMLFNNQIGRASAFYWGKWLPFVITRADSIIADSQYTKKDLMEHLKIKDSMIRVVYPSGHEAFSALITAEKISAVKQTLGINGRYFLFVGTLEPRKNLDRILAAFKIFSERNSNECQLVLAGSKDFGHGKYTAILAQKHAMKSGSIIATGFLDHESLNALYCGAQALLFPSLYEGFGIPILEAMASGCPVLTSNLTSTPEVAGDAAILVDPYSVEAIAQGITDLATQDSLRQELRRKGFEQIKTFSWKKAAQETIEVYKNMLGC